MSIVVDTNILVYALNRDCAQHEKARKFLEECRDAGEFCTTWSILYEWLRVVTHPRVLSKPLAPAKALEFVQTVARDPRTDILVETTDHPRFLARTLDLVPGLRGNLWHDAHVAALMFQHGISTIATADAHFRLFPALNVLDPCRDRRPVAEV